MKKILGIVVLGLLFSSKSYAESNCLKMLNGYVPDDNMIKLAYLTKKSLTFYINNIINMRDVKYYKKMYNNIIFFVIFSKSNTVFIFYLDATNHEIQTKKQLFIIRVVLFEIIGRWERGGG